MKYFFIALVVLPFVYFNVLLDIALVFLLFFVSISLGSFLILKLKTV